MPVNQQYNLFGKKVSQTYHNLLQSGSDGKFYDGDGNEVTINATIPDIYVLTSSFNAFTSSYSTGSFTGSFTGSLLGTASYALNGGVTQITAGGGIIISPSNGLGNVTINSTAATYNTATGSYGSFYDTGSYTATSATAIYSMSLSTTDISNGVYVSGSDRTRIYVTNAGVYNFQFSAQFSNSSNNDPQDVAVWLRKNDGSSTNDIVDSNSFITVPGAKGGDPGQIIAAWNFFLQLSAGDFVQLLWHAERANIITLETINAGTNPTHPRTPSLIATVQRVDTFLSNTGSFSGSFTGEFTGSLLGTGSWAVSASQAISSSYSDTSQTTSTITVNSFGSNVESYLLMSNVVALPGVAIGGDADLRYNASTNRLSVGSVSATSLTGSLQGTASWADNATTASYVLNAVSSSFALTASFASTASFVRNAISSSYPISASGTTIVSVLPGGISSGNNNSIFLGANAGSGVTSAYNSNFLGYLAGQSATFASQANFIGAGAGIEATRADNSNFFGLFAGQKAVSASFSTLIGYQAGANPDGTATIGTNNIIIGSNITLPANTRNSINLGGIIFATGSYSSLVGNPYSGSQFNIGRVGINKVLPIYTLDVSGSGNYSNGLTVTGSVIATSFTGSLLGTGSWAVNSISSSNSVLLNGISSSQFARVDTNNTFNGVNTTTQKTLRTSGSYTIVETSYASTEIPPDTLPLNLFNVYDYVSYSADKTFENTSLIFDYTMVSIDGLSIRSGRVNLNWSPDNSGADTIIDNQILTDVGTSLYITFGYTVDYTPGNESVRLNIFNDLANSLATVFIRGFLRII